MSEETIEPLTDLAFSSRTPEKMYYSKLRSAFTHPGVVPQSSHVGSYSRLNENEVPFAMLMQQQYSHEHEQQSKQNLDTSSDFESESAPDDFIIVEVVGRDDQHRFILISLF